ncbi:putative lipase [Trypanosoma cruzi]|uniref:Putative lipase n=1 Tax=Trypanosoma cruzi TaxID=5693 RepID=A0A2V2WYT0_TRYCR|nr:putative lipase [Trypanosoma cruzi]
MSEHQHPSHHDHVESCAASSARDSAPVSFEGEPERDLWTTARGHEDHPSETFQQAWGENQERVKSRVIPQAPRRNLYLSSGKTPPVEASKNGTYRSFNFSRHFSSEPVELQIEGLSPLVGQTMLYMWYAVIIAAAIVQGMEFVSWGLVSICGEEVSDLRQYDKWNSPCVRTKLENATGDLYTIRWEGGPYGAAFESATVRFPNIVMSLASPDDWGHETDSTRTYNIQAVIPHAANTDEIFTFPLHVTCTRSSRRCAFVQLPPEAVLNETSSETRSLTLRGVPATLARVANKSSVGIVFQRYAYSLGIFIWRYMFLLISFLHLVRFIVYKKFTSTLYEQSWVVVLQLALFWYLNPLYALNYSKNRPSLVLNSLEFQFPTWFVAVFVGFMLSAITASMPWTPPPHGQRHVKYNLLTLSGIKGYLCHSASVYDPPLWTKCLVVVYILIIVALDIVGESLHVKEPLEAWGGGLPSTSYLLAALILLGCLVCCVLLIHLHRNMGKKSYLDSRPQQLASRVLILVFVTSMIYYTFHIIMFFLRYKKIPGMSVTQPMIQLPAIMVSTILVNIMTLIYTTRNRSRLVPIHPRDKRWKMMVWPNTWYRWLSRHGGSMYIFHTEAEELSFNWNQIGYRIRQHKAKVMRRKGRKGGTSHSRRAVAHGPGQNSHHPHAEDEAPSEIPTFRSPQATPTVSVTTPYIETLESRDILNMDVTSTWFLPPQTCSPTAPPAIQQSFHSRLPSEERNGSESVDQNRVLRAERCHNIPNSPCPIDWRWEPQMSSSLPPIAPFRETGEPALFDAWNQPLGRQERASGLAESGNTVTSAEGRNVGEAEEEEEEEEEGAPNVAARTISRAREKLDRIIRGAERTLISGPLQAFEHFETFLLDAAMRPFQDLEYLPFFNLETAIDCFNLSWEAYGTSHRPEGRMEGRIVRCTPFSISRLCWLCCCCCLSPSSLDGLLRVPVEDSAEAPVGSETHPTENEDGPQIQRSPSGYNEPPPIDVERYGYRLCAVMEALDVQVVISALDSPEAINNGKAPRIVIAFRGTMSMSNAWQDLRVRRVVWEEMMEGETRPFQHMCFGWKPTVHVGFLSIWNAHREHVYRRLWEELSANPSTVYRVFCTGHSLGGALATLCAYSVCKMLRQKNYPLLEVTVYTYGQPPLGNKAFQKAYNKAVPRTFRVVNESDAVGLIRMYGCHVGIEVDIDRHGNYICKPTYMERLFRPMKGKGFAVENHLMGSYAASLNAIARDTGCPSVACLGETNGDADANPVAVPEQQGEPGPTG